MILQKQFWQLKRSLRFLDQRSIAVPIKYQEANGGSLKFDRVEFTQVMSAWEEDSRLCFEYTFGSYRFPKELFSNQDVLLFEQLCRDRPRVWW